MSRRLIGVLAVPAVVLIVGAQSAPANRSRPGAAIVEVAAGKPSEFHFTFSKQKVPQGAVTFQVTNEGKLPHDFEIDGKKTKLLSPGESQRLVVRFEKAGRYPYMCTGTGHAVAGMRGTLEVTATAVGPGEGDQRHRDRRQAVRVPLHALEEDGAARHRCLRGHEQGLTPTRLRARRQEDQAARTGQVGDAEGDLPEGRPLPVPVHGGGARDLGDEGNARGDRRASLTSERPS
jgi:plastocyanin